MSRQIIELIICKRKKMKEIIKLHKKNLKEIKTALKPIESCINTQVENFIKSKSRHKYNSARTIKGYSKWTKDVIKRFEGHCFICLSNNKVVAHHLNSYKYYIELRTDINNGVCLCNSCHTFFHDLYKNVNSHEHFFEFIKIMANGKLAKRAKESVKAHRVNDFIESLIDCGETFKIRKFKHLSFVSYGNLHYTGLNYYIRNGINKTPRS